MKYFLLIFSILSFSQQFKNVNFISAEANLVINEKNKSVFGSVDYDFIVVSPIDTVRIDAKSMTFTSVFINQKKVQFKNSGKQLHLFTGFKKGLNKLHVVYEAVPKQTLYFLGSKAADNLQIWTQGQGKYTSNWLPSFDDVNEKLIFKINVTFD
ncbi:MAG: M1 family peptidase, partial [Flavobacterium sp.]|nr:M1 family peptidase [Flavobacterium sp.]